jgi:GNAT superfamily N-acetyltransferase
LEIQIADSGEERRRLYELRYEIQVEEIGLEPYGTFHKLHAVRDDFDVDAEHLFLEVNGDIAAGMRLLICAEIQLPDLLREAYSFDRFQGFTDEHFAIFDHYLVRPEYRETEIAEQLFNKAYRHVRDKGVRFCFCYTTPSLSGLFEKIGFRRYAKNFVEPTLGLQTPLVLVVDDLAYLQKMNSPLAVVAAEYGEDKNNDGEWLSGQFALAREFDGTPMRNVTEFWKHMTAELHKPPLIGLPIFLGMSVQDAYRFIKNSLIVHLDDQEFLMREGDIGNEMYVLLSGAVEIQSQGKRIAAFGPGGVIGEISFLSEMPRSADVKVVQAAEFLVLTQNTFRKIMRSMPDVAAQVLFNMSLMLCDRLYTSTQNWIDGIQATDVVVEKPAD